MGYKDSSGYLTKKKENNEPLKNLKFADILKLFISALFLDKKISNVSIDFIENLKDNGKIEILNARNQTILKGLNKEEIMEQNKKGFEPFFRSLLINLGTPIIRNDYFKFMLLSSEDKNLQNFLTKLKQQANFKIKDELSLLKLNSNFEVPKDLNFSLLRKEFNKNKTFKKDLFNLLFSELTKEEEKYIDISKYENMKIIHPSFQNGEKTISINNLFNSFSKRIDEFLDTYIQVLFEKDPLTYVTIKNLENLNKNKIGIITDGRFESEIKYVLEKFPKLPLTVIIPKNSDGTLNLKSKENEELIKLYENSKTIKEFTTNTNLPKLGIMVAEELSTLLVLHNYIKTTPDNIEGFKLNSILDKEIDSFAKNYIVFDNKRDDLYNLKNNIQNLLNKLQEDKKTIFISISGGGKDTIFGIMNSLLNEKDCNKDIDDTLKKITLIANKETINLSKKDKEVFFNFLKEKLPDEKENLDFLKDTTIGDYIYSIYEKNNTIDKKKSNYLSKS